MSDQVNQARRIKRWAWAPEHRCFAVTTPGLEDLCAAELEALGLGPVETEVGGVNFEAKLDGVFLANLWLRTAGRILLRLRDFRVRTFTDLAKQAVEVPWEAFINPEVPLRLQVSLQDAYLRHSGQVAEEVYAALGRRMRPLGLEVPPLAAPGAEDQDLQRLYIRGYVQRASLSLDASGEHLHRRGYRLATAKAPLREDLAAGLLMLAGYRGQEPLWDPMCGAGTLAIEAAHLAIDRAPGLTRPFAMEKWACRKDAAWARLRRLAAEKVLPAPPYPILASDKQAGAVQAATDNANRAGLEGLLELRQADLFSLRPPAGAQGLVVANPPYGQRIADQKEALALARRLGEHMARHCPGWRAALVLPQSQWADQMGLERVEQWPVPHGGLRVWLTIGVIPGAGDQPQQG